jgi:hypothetical protein
MKKFRVSVSATIDSTFDVEAKNEDEAVDLAEVKFIKEFSCVSSGIEVPFDQIEAWDWEEIK